MVKLTVLRKTRIVKPLTFGRGRHLYMGDEDRRWWRAQCDVQIYEMTIEIHNRWETLYNKLSSHSHRMTQIGRFIFARHNWWAVCKDSGYMVFMNVWLCVISQMGHILCIERIRGGERGGFDYWWLMIKGEGFLGDSDLEINLQWRTYKQLFASMNLRLIGGE